MNISNSCDISVAITGSGGAGSITAGELLLSLAKKMTDLPTFPPRHICPSKKLAKKKKLRGYL